MNEQQRRFCEFYAASGNAAEAARLAGYSERTARSQGQRLLTDVDIAQYVRGLQDQAAAGRIADMIEVKEVWTGVLRNDNAKAADRLKAGELLARAAGAFLHFRPNPEGGGIIAAGEMADGDVVIYVPQMLREEDCQVKESKEDDG